MMNWKKPFVCILCFCFLNNNVNGILIPLGFYGAPLLLSSMVAMLSPTPATGQIVYPNPYAYSILARLGYVLNNIADNLFGNYIGRLFRPSPLYINGNGPGSVAGTGISVVTNSFLQFLHMVNEVIADSMHGVYVFGLFIVRMINEVIARILSFIFGNRSRSGSGNKGGGAGNKLQNALTRAIALLALLRPRMRGPMGIVGNAIGGLLNAAKGVLNTIKDITRGGGGIAKTVSAIIRNLIVKPALAAAKAVANALRLPGQLLKGAGNAAKNTRNAAQGALNGANAIGKAVSSVAKALNNFFIRGPANILRGIARGVGNIFKNIAQFLALIIIPRLSLFAPFKALGNIANNLKKLGSALSAPARNIANGIRDIFKSIRSEIWQLLRSFIVSTIVTTLNNIRPKPLKAISNALNGLRNGIGNITKGLGKLLKGGPLGLVRNAISMILQGIRKFLRKIPTPGNILRNLASGLGSRLRNLFTNALSITSIISNIRARQKKLVVTIGSDLLKIGRGVLQILLALATNFGGGFGIAGSIIRNIFNRRNRSGSNRPSVSGAISGFINGLTSMVKRASSGNGLLSRLARIVNDILFVLEPFFYAILGGRSSVVSLPSTRTKVN